MSLLRIQVGAGALSIGVEIIQGREREQKILKHRIKVIFG